MPLDEKRFTGRINGETAFYEKVLNGRLFGAIIRIVGVTITVFLLSDEVTCFSQCGADTVDNTDATDTDAKTTSGIPYHKTKRGPLQKQDDKGGRCHGAQRNNAILSLNGTGSSVSTGKKASAYFYRHMDWISYRLLHFSQLAPRAVF